ALRRVELYGLQRQCLLHKPARDASAIGVVPDCWFRFYAKLSPPGLVSQGTVFLHEMKTPAGQRRMVAVDLVRACVNSRGGYDAVPRVFTLGSPMHLPRELRCRTSWFSFSGDVRVDVAELDPSDLSHFTFRYSKDGQESFVDGWLSDDDTITLEHR